MLPTQEQHLAEEKLNIRNKFWKLVRTINLQSDGTTAWLIFLIQLSLEEPYALKIMLRRADEYVISE